jgi:hypothetical protein
MTSVYWLYYCRLPDLELTNDKSSLVDHPLETLPPRSRPSDDGVRGGDRARPRFYRWPFGTGFIG